MRRFAGFLLTLHLVAGQAIAQVPQTTTTPGMLEIRQGSRVSTIPQGSAPAENLNGAMGNESLITFDPQHADVVWTQNHWQLIADGHILKDFGRREVEAHLALRLVRDLHLTQHGIVGSPDPVMEYWLSNGHAPHGSCTGLHVTQVDPNSLKVENAKGQWCVRDASRVLFNFRTHESDARTALAILHKYQFTQIGTLGNMGPTMIVMLGHFDANMDPNQSMPHLTRQSPLHADPKAAKSPTQPGVNDANPLVTPAIGPLRTAQDGSKHQMNEFGRQETVEVLPSNLNSRSMVDPQVRQASASMPGEAVPMLPPAATTIVKRTPTPLPQSHEMLERVPLDWRQFQVRTEKDGQFTVAAGNFVLARFRNDHDARMAMAAMQHYRFTELDRVGPSCTYFLCNGQAPRGQFIGMHTEPFQPEKLSVAPFDNHWAIMTPDKPLAHFGAKQEEARLMVDLIQKQQFDRLCHIGDEQGLTFFIRSH